MAFSLTLIPFTLLSIFIFVSIYKSLSVEKTMQSVYWLIFMLVAVGFIFLLGNSEIMFAYQLMVYSGGIAVLMLFAGLLTEQDELFIETSVLGFIKTTKTQFVIFVIFAVDMILLIFSAVIGNTVYNNDSVLGDTSMTYIQSNNQTKLFAIYLWDDFGTILIMLGLILLSAILGSVKLAIREQDLEELSDEYLARNTLLSEDLNSLPGMEEVAEEIKE